MKTNHMWALMLSTGDVYQEEWGWWKDVFDIHSLFKTRKAAREHAKVFESLHKCVIKKILIED